MSRIAISRSLKASSARKALQKYASAERALAAVKFFKTAPGEYAARDVFCGVKVPDIRHLAKDFSELPLAECTLLLKSKIHEERMLALLILCQQFAKGDEKSRKKIYSLYLKNLRGVNNWDLVDTSAPLLVGGFLYDRARSPLYKLARSRDLWKKRVAMLATFYFIRKNDFKDTLQIAEILLLDEEDLIHKAVGWLLREVANRDQKLVIQFLERHAHRMPRTMLSYSIEKFPVALKKKFRARKT